MNLGAYRPDCLALEQLEMLGGDRWHVQLAPDLEGYSQSQLPEWLGYRQICMAT